MICRSALIEGKLRGSLQCFGTATINFVGKIPGRLTAAHVVVERKSRVQFFRRVRVKTMEIRGRMTGEVIAEDVVVDSQNGWLDGNVTAKCDFGGEGRNVFGPARSSAERPDTGRIAARQRASGSRERDGAGLCLSAVARDFVVELMHKVFPRSPYERLGGYVHLPRLIDKARLHRKGLLDGYNYKTIGFDKHLLAFLKLDPEAFEETANRTEERRGHFEMGARKRRETFAGRNRALE